jgi:N-acetylglucosamine kinase-like BadF-type ATPase
MSAVLAVDGGNSKTDLALVALDGALLARVRGPGCSPHALGVTGSIAVIGDLRALALEQAGFPTDGVARVAAVFCAGVDEPHEEATYRDAVRATGWAADVVVTNDTFAVLRAGTPREWGVAVVCGAGMNACAVAPDGRHGRYQALGELSGDWGGGCDVGVAALGAAIRGSDLRGPTTTLSRLVPEQLGYESAESVADAVHKRRLPLDALGALPPTVFAAARDGDVVARSIVDRLADEVVAMSTALIRRLDLTETDVPVVLGGGLLQSGDTRLIERIVRGVLDVAPRADVHPLTAAPLLGAIRTGLVQAAATPEALARVERELAAQAVMSA